MKCRLTVLLRRGRNDLRTDKITGTCHVEPTVDQCFSMESDAIDDGAEKRAITTSTVRIAFHERLGEKIQFTTQTGSKYEWEKL